MSDAPTGARDDESADETGTTPAAGPTTNPGDAERSAIPADDPHAAMTDHVAAATTTPIEAFLRYARRRWIEPPTLEAEAAVDELIPDGDDFVNYLSRFTVLIVLSAGIASFGLLANSAAVVIGAMLVAPLMTPITAAAAATVMARNARLVRSLVVIAFGTAAAVLVGFATARVAGTHLTGATDLPSEVLARTFPGLLDLGVAITAGAAAGYILPRRSTSGALPGVGIAVALVPPLASVGITAAVGARQLAANAFLLYLTNLAAIIFAASVMLILAGFRPEGAGRSLMRRLVITAVAVVVVTIPLTSHTRSALRDVNLRRSVSQSVVEWDDTVRVVDLNADVGSGRATVDLLVSGPNEPRPAWQLMNQIQRRFDGPVELQLQYQQNNLFQVSGR